MGSPLRYDAVLARYGEIGIKSRPVRRRFELALQENIERAFETEGLDCIVTRIPGRFVVTSSDIPRATDILARIFGLTSVSPVRIATSELAKLLPEIARYFDEVAATRPNARTFALRTRRSGQHPYTSQDLARDGGGAVLDRPEGARWKVDLGRPDIEVSIDVRDARAFLHHEQLAGPGGLPVGTQGKVVLLLKDLNSLIAAWMMMKRGCTVIPVTFLGPTGNLEKAKSLLASLRQWYFRSELVELSHGETSEFPAKLACVLCMRQMIRKADLFARRKKAKAIVTGETFTSTTIENLPQFGGLAHMPVLRPLLGMTPQLIGEFAQRARVELGRGTQLFEACPYRVHGRVEEEDVHRSENELGQEARAHNSIRARVAEAVTR